MRLKTKLVFGLTFLFIVILVFGILGIFYINQISNDSQKVLKNNHESLLYSNSMLKALEDIPIKKNAIQVFDQNLKKQEINITEAGEKESTANLRKNFEGLLKNMNDSSNYAQIRQALYLIIDLNQQAILRKNAVVQKTAEEATLWLTLIFTFLTLIAFSFVVNFPGVISNPIRILAEGFKEIANKNYKKRIYLKQKDEFGDLADTFNLMAEKLDEYESSSLAKITFEKRRIETLINQMKDGIIGLDEKGNVLFLNEVSEKIFALKEKDIIGKYAADIAVKNDLMRTILQDETRKDLKIYADNKESYFNKDIINVKSNEQIIGQVIVLRNITPFHELNEAKTNFIATVSHELKTPISSIKMSAKLLNDSRVGELNADQNELIKSIADDAERLLTITGELLNMSQVETGNIQLKITAADPVEIIELAIQSVKLLAQQKNVSLSKELQKNLPPVNADIEKTSWVLTNLLSNAIKHSPESSSIEIACYRKDNMLEFSVKDNGNGIEEKYVPKVFDKYFKIPGTQESTGSGLGLAISKEFIEAQSGVIGLNSKPGSGSDFFFSLPVSAP